MKIHTRDGELPFTTFTFPDGQPHFKLLMTESRVEDLVCTIETAISSPADLFLVLLAKNVLDANGFLVSLDIRYLMGARMDRAIDVDQPFTLAVVCRILKGAGFCRIRVLDPHSPVTLRLLGATPVLPKRVVGRLLRAHHPEHTVVVAPDAGARDRVMELSGESDFPIVCCSKHRDPESGALTDFRVDVPSLVFGKHCFILDDICDGGRTFTGIATVLKEAGALAVDLFVTHGIFSKGTRIPGIRRCFVTDSRELWWRKEVNGVADATLLGDVTVLPIDMSKEE